MVYADFKWKALNFIHFMFVFVFEA